MPNGQREKTRQVLREEVERTQREYIQAIETFNGLDGIARSRRAVEAYAEAVKRYSGFNRCKVIPLTSRKITDNLPPA